MRPEKLIVAQGARMLRRREALRCSGIILDGRIYNMATEKRSQAEATSEHKSSHVIDLILHSRCLL
jgi:hypothetical protein